MTSLLIVDDDPDITEFMQINLELDGFDVRVAGDGEEALRAIEQALPDLVLVDVMMPKVDGMELCRRLRGNPRTANLPIIMVTAKTLPADKVVGLTVGADDYISKPFDTVELTARVRTTLRRNAEMRAVSPLTGLPGNHRIDAEIAERVAQERGFALCHLDLDNFKAFNDCYGFLRGDEVISVVATALRQAAAESAGPPCFIGHIGGDDFVLVCEPEQAEPVCRRVIDIVDDVLPTLHDPADVARGYLELTDRQGDNHRYPLVSLSIGIALSGPREFSDHREVVAVASELKHVAKATPGSAIAVDRRRS